LFREFRVPGWSGPSTRSQSVVSGSPAKIAHTASRDSSTASAAPCGYGSPGSRARYYPTGSALSRSRYVA
jgi:hypothetical protein